MRNTAIGTVLVACFAFCALAQFNPSKPAAKPVKSDIKYIQCQVCELLAKNAYRQVNDMKKAVTPNKKLEEMAVIELMEHITDPSKDQGEWIAKVDLVESGDKLLVEEQAELGDCGVECKTVQRAAEEIVGDSDTDLAEELWKSKLNRSQFTNWLCRQLTPSCKAKTPKLPADRKPGPPFTVLDEQQAQLQKMMAGMKKGKVMMQKSEISMVPNLECTTGSTDVDNPAKHLYEGIKQNSMQIIKEQGMGGTVYDRDTIMKKYMNGYDDDYEDDDDEEIAPAGAKQPLSAAKDTVGKLAEKASNVAGSALSYTQEKLSNAFSLLKGDRKAPPAVEL